MEISACLVWVVGAVVMAICRVCRAVSEHQHWPWWSRDFSSVKFLLLVQLVGKLVALFFSLRNPSPNIEVPVYLVRVYSSKFCSLFVCWFWSFFVRTLYRQVCFYPFFNPQYLHYLVPFVTHPHIFHIMEENEEGPIHIMNNVQIEKKGREAY